MTNSKRIAITGATGLVGTALNAALRKRGNIVIPISRSSQPEGVVWDLEKGELPTEQLNGLEAVIHLAGAGVADERWTPSRKQVIRDSRIKSAKLLIDTLSKVSMPPKTFISASGIGYYGPKPAQECDESSPLGPGFLADVCREWETAAHRAEEFGARVVIARLGVILSPEGGALARMLLPFKLGLGGPVGSGKQRLGWIVLDDVVRAILFLLDHSQATGPFNLTAPQIITNAAFADTLGKALNRPTKLPAPRFALKLAFGELVDETLLADSPSIPKRLTELGFDFQFPKLDAALRDMLK
ncbi:TIGR01777 family oxidoreductase [Cerasicoccus arenae]|uniref:Epimerase family protein n=1 Tax=Cerasicoccus arenae TaxID=424488 RepID=A0A8J3GDX3_9BACT|nr:TIGR01777 family oxidoreductase [Cerasicoccus arenae]MBK1856710.1 TIGR01777 family oxidoreductase [Cerasicoccus arenae]GHB99061.1 epimerase family protein [Cerasicoccus arenae]